jgi:hypothetical protein
VSKPLSIPRLECEKCHKPMTWHSMERVKPPAGEHWMLVFHCEVCRRFSAILAESAVR